MCNLFKEIVLEEMHVSCHHCGGNYDLPTYGDDISKIIYASNSTTIAYLDIDDKLYSHEIKNFVAANAPERLSLYFRVITDMIFKITCDPINGQVPDPLWDPIIACRICDNEDIEVSKYPERKFVTQKVPFVSHRKWELLSDNEKQMFMKNELHQAVNIIDEAINNKTIMQILHNGRVFDKSNIPLK